MEEKQDSHASVPAVLSLLAEQYFEIDVSIEVSSDLLVDDTPEPRRPAAGREV